MSKLAKFMPLFLLALVLATFVGCGTLDGFFLAPTDPVTGVATGPSVATQIGEAASAFIPGWGKVGAFALGLLGSVWAYFRGSKREKLLPALIIDIVQGVMAAKDGKVDADALYKTLANAQTLFANKQKFIDLVETTKTAVHDALLDGFQSGDLVTIVAAVEAKLKAVTDIPAPGTGA